MQRALHAVKDDEQLARDAGLRPKTKKFRLPVDHQPGMKVPKAGASCSTCKHLGNNATCDAEGFRDWNGSKNIPGGDPTTYCSDWYEPR